MQQRSCNAYVIRTPARRPRILVEDDALDLDVVDLCPPGAGAYEVILCDGPHGREPCPLVLDGACPAGRPDVVVCTLDPGNPWAVSVRAAWEREGVPVAGPGAGEPPLVWPAHVGAALRAFFDG